MRRSTLILTLVLLLTCISLGVRAQPTAEAKAAAKQKLQKGLDRFNSDKPDYAGALQDFEDSYDLDPLPATAAMAAQAQANVDHEHPSFATKWLLKWHAAATVGSGQGTKIDLTSVGGALTAIQQCAQQTEKELVDTEKTLGDAKTDLAKCEKYRFSSDYAAKVLANKLQGLDSQCKAKLGSLDELKLYMQP